jgi:cobalamin biosynthesis Mg chelatase CobN
VVGVIRPGLVAILAAISLSIAPAAAHASAQNLISDCITNGKIVGHYPIADYIQALAHLPTDVDEYSDCSDVIRRAEQNLAAGGKTAAAAAAAAPANPRANPLATAAPSEQAAVSQAEASGAREVQLGAGPPGAPGVVATRTASVSNGLPTPLLVALAIVVLIALAVGGWRARKLVRARRAL